MVIFVNTLITWSIESQVSIILLFFTCFLLLLRFFLFLFSYCVYIQILPKPCFSNYLILFTISCFYNVKCCKYLHMCKSSISTNHFNHFFNTKHINSRRNIVIVHNLCHDKLPHNNVVNDQFYETCSTSVLYNLNMYFPRLHCSRSFVIN